MTDHLAHLHPSEMTPAERAAAVASILAAGLLRHLHPAAFPAPAGTTNSQENQENRLDASRQASVTVHAG